MNNKLKIHFYHNIQRKNKILYGLIQNLEWLIQRHLLIGYKLLKNKQMIHF